MCKIALIVRFELLNSDNSLVFTNIHLPRIGLTMDVTTVIATTSSTLAIGGTLFAVARWVLKHHTAEIVKDYLSELKPNHGTSLNDKIVLEVLPLLQHVHDDMVEVKLKVAKLEGRFEQHVDEGE
jgi:hypothetical protein